MTGQGRNPATRRENSRNAPGEKIFGAPVTLFPVLYIKVRKQKNNSSKENIRRERVLDMSKKLNEKKMDREEMKEVTGGTVNEYADLLQALTINPKLKKWGKFAAHLPGGNMVALNASDGIKGILKEIDIKADISLGFGGTGLFSSNNKYTRISTGERMTHEEVIATMKKHFTLD